MLWLYYRKGLSSTESSSIAIALSTKAEFPRILKIRAELMKSGFAIGAYTPCNQLLWICTAIEAIKLQTFYVAPEDVTMYGIYAMATIYIDIKTHDQRLRSCSRFQSTARSIRFHSGSGYTATRTAGTRKSTRVLEYSYLSTYGSTWNAR